MFKKYILLIVVTMIFSACADVDSEHLDRIEKKVDEIARLSMMQRFRELDDIAAENLNYSFMGDSQCTSFDSMFDVTGKGIFELREKAEKLGYLDVVKDIDEITQLTLNITNAKCKRNVLIWNPNKYSHQSSK